MHIVACLPQDHLPGLKATLGPDTSVRAVYEMAELVEVCRSMTADALIIDPGYGREDFVEAIVRQATGLPITLILYTDLATPTVAQRILQAACAKCVDVAIRASDGAPDAWWRRVRLRSEGRAAAMLLHRIARRLQSLPTALQPAILKLFCGTDIPASVSDLARDANVSRQVLDRWSRRIGLRSPKAIIDAARLARYRDLRREEAHPHPIVLTTVGFESVRTAAECCRRFTRLPLRHAIQDLSTHDFVDRVVAELASEPVG